MGGKGPGVSEQSITPPPDTVEVISEAEGPEGRKKKWESKGGEMGKDRGAESDKGEGI